MRIRSLIIASFILALTLPGLCLAAPARGTVATNITAERMQYDASGQKVIFSGNVHVARPDFELWSTSLTAHLQKKEDGAKAGGTMQTMNAGQIERIVAEGSVRMKSGVRTGTCGRATYTLGDGKIVMERKPEILDTSNNSKIGGDTIVFYTRDGKSDVIGGVRASFSTSDGGGISLGGDSSQDAAPETPAAAPADPAAPETGAAQ